MILDVRSAPMFICNKTKNENNLNSINLKAFLSFFLIQPDVRYNEPQLRQILCRPLPKGKCILLFYEIKQA